MAGPSVFRTVAIGVGLLGAFGIGLAVGQNHDSGPKQGVLDSAASTIAKNGATQSTIDRLRQAAVSGMLMSVGDPWGSYLDAAQNDVRLDATAGTYAGVGAWLHQVGSKVAVANVNPGGPAAAAGMLVGDDIESVGGRATSGLTAAAVGRLLTGDPGTVVAVGISRNGLVSTVKIARRTLDNGAVKVTHMPGGVVVIRITQFSSGTGRQVRAAVADKHATGFVLDLRGNPGGLLVEGVETASAFLNGGAVVTLDRRGQQPETFNAPVGGTKLPVVVLVDHGTASAAEIVAGALQDRGRAVLVGERTFGKAAVQEPFALGNGSAIELTVGHYLTPNGSRIDGAGLTPDLVVDSSAGDPLQRAVAVLAGYTALASN
jgi:carboxyl-terminal processing protease